MTPTSGDPPLLQIGDNVSIGAYVSQNIICLQMIFSLLVNSLDKEMAQGLRVPRDAFSLNPLLTEVAVRDG